MILHNSASLGSIANEEAYRAGGESSDKFEKRHKKSMVKKSDEAQRWVTSQSEKEAVHMQTSTDFGDENAESIFIEFPTMIFGPGVTHVTDQGANRHYQPTVLWLASHKQIAEYHQRNPKVAAKQLAEKYVVKDSKGQLVMSPDLIPKEVEKDGAGLASVENKTKLDEKAKSDIKKNLKKDQGKKGFSTKLDKSELKKQVIGFERRVEHMYLDTAKIPNVTVGIGINIKDTKKAKKFPFVWQKDETEEDRKNGYGTGQEGAPLRKAGSLATKKDILKEHKYIQDQTKKMDAKNYKKFTRLRLGDKTIDSTYDAEVLEKKGQLKKLFPEFDSFPAPAKLALLNMIFNMGYGTFSTFDNLITHVLARNWQGASEECIYNSSDDAFWERNTFNQTKFIEAAEMDPL
ncbi:MAG: hypothetical protein QNL04_04065 [SAR324 cluster bacterium]|nr:hypothetical protein [SAR324 cluster bacterium]